MAADFHNLVADLERSYEETQTRMSDPSVYNDRREAAEVGRRLKELEGPWKLAQEWKQARDDLAAARGDGELVEMVPDYEAEVSRLEDELKLALAERDPADEKDVIVEIRGGEGGEEGKLWAGDLARILQRYAERRGFRWEQLEVSPRPSRRVGSTLRRRPSPSCRRPRTWMSTSTRTTSRSTSTARRAPGASR